jgi:isoamylase
VSWDASSYIRDPKDSPEPEHHSGSWVENNIINPAINGSGVIQIHNTFTSKENDWQLKQTEAAPLGSTEWAVQSLAGAAGAIVPYVVAGKLTGKVLGSTAEHFGMTGASAKFMTSTAVANVLGAGAYDFIKAPNAGETRFGNAAGTMAGFSVFEAGNAYLGKGTRLLENPALRLPATVLGRASVGALGGMASYDTSHIVSSWLGQKDERNWTNRFESMAGGAFLNVTLPVVNDGVTRAVDYAYNSRSYGPGIPVERYLATNGIKDPELIETARNFNPNARIKVATDGVTKADVKSNTVFVGEEAPPGKIAHELRHLRVARELEPQYKALSQIIKEDPTRAQNQFMNMRHYSEFQARLQQAIFDSRRSVGDLDRVIGTAGDIPSQTASNGKTYRSNWESEWNEMKRNPNYRPRFEYSPDATTDAKAPEAKPESRNIVVTDKAFLGSPEHLGATVTDKGINFAVRSQNAVKMELLLFDNSATATKPLQSLDMNRTGDVWHRFVPDVGDGQTYLYRAHGEYNPALNGNRFNGNLGLIDPYAKAITGDSNRPIAYDNSNPNDAARDLRVGTGDKVEGMSKAVAVRADNFDWKDDKPPAHPMEDSFIYELNVKGFTGGIEELGKLSGTYRGLMEKIPHLKQLGVTAVELMPVFQFEKIDTFNGTMHDLPTNPENGKPLRNQWGYQTIGYQAPEASYAADGVRGQQVNEFKTMVQNLHSHGIEVILDVVFNHTAEDGNRGPTISFRGLDNKVYYMLAPNAPEQYLDHTGCRNTLNVNEPAVRALIMDTLRYWTKEMHVDGFRFDLATVFNYDVDNIDKPKTPIIHEIETDPVLKHVKLIAEPWSIDQYKIGNFSDTRWAEWNGVFRDTVRRFLKSDSGQLSDLAERITGSRKWYDASKGRYSINFVTAHDGFRMEDLFSYNEKHNFGNGEGNRDGSGENFSWNHGVEGPVEKANLPENMKVAIENLRSRQVKNAFALLLLSQGTPMMLSGDEFRQSSHGNNNYWPQEELNRLDWSLADKNADTVRFVELMSALRKEFKIGWRQPEETTWHGTKPFDQKFDENGRYIAWELPATEGQPKRLYSGFNAYWEPLEIELPAGKWRRRVDTNLPKGQEIVGPNEGAIIDGGKYTVMPRTGVVFESVP